MLSDLERKVLRILWSLYHNAWCVPDINRLSRLSGRRNVMQAIQSLVDVGHVEHKDGRYRVIHPWEHEPRRRIWIDMPRR